MAPTFFEEGQKDLGYTEYYVGRDSSKIEGRNFITTSKDLVIANYF